MVYDKKFMDSLISESLTKRKKVSLFLCKDEEGGFGVKIDGIEIDRNFPWETFEVEINKERFSNIRNKLGFRKE